ncbi:hypothetical protein [Streptomyces sp. NRRL WC-3742]|uniref:hypothetical protein n=1 Tax=Streptomyces sp. NRRL WC-3742 TaxID=1463934 RepID=UPI000B0E3380|nr:hypothetical protein [Streptomyces sp. NRRL WC-3742]
MLHQVLGFDETATGPGIFPVYVAIGALLRTPARQPAPEKVAAQDATAGREHGEIRLSRVAVSIMIARMDF